MQQKLQANGIMRVSKLYTAIYCNLLVMFVDRSQHRCCGANKTKRSECCKDDGNQNPGCCFEHRINESTHWCNTEHERPVRRGYGICEKQDYAFDSGRCCKKGDGHEKLYTNTPTVMECCGSTLELYNNSSQSCCIKDNTIVNRINRGCCEKGK